MKIRDEHFYHGAVLNQIAEHKNFTAINALKIKNRKSRSAFLINDSISIYLKYASKPIGSYKEYNFTFTKNHLSNLRAIHRTSSNLYLTLICVQDKEICCIPYTDFLSLINLRKEEFGKKEDQYTILVTLKPNEGFRVYMNAPGTKNTCLKKQKVARNRCPNIFFK